MVSKDSVCLDRYLFWPAPQWDSWLSDTLPGLEYHSAACPADRQATWIGKAATRKMDRLSLFHKFFGMLRLQSPLETQKICPKFTANNAEID